MCPVAFVSIIVCPLCCMCIQRAAFVFCFNAGATCWQRSRLLQVDVCGADPFGALRDCLRRHRTYKDGSVSSLLLLKWEGAASRHALESNCKHPSNKPHCADKKFPLESEDGAFLNINSAGLVVLSPPGTQEEEQDEEEASSPPPATQKTPSPGPSR